MFKFNKNKIAEVAKGLKSSKRILIHGSAGSGKSTFSRKISKILGLDTIHMDKEYWNPNWQKPDPVTWHEHQMSIYERESWIIEGGAYIKTMPIRVKRSDFIIYLKFNRLFCLYRCFKRFFMFRNKARPDMKEGCREKIDYRFIKWIIHDQPDVYGPMAIKAIIENIEHENFIIIKSNSKLKQLERELGIE